MSDDLDLRSLEQRHEPDPEFRAALGRRVVAIVTGSDPSNVNDTPDGLTIDAGSPSDHHRPTGTTPRQRRRVRGVPDGASNWRGGAQPQFVQVELDRGRQSSGRRAMLLIAIGLATAAALVGLVVVTRTDSPTIGGTP